MQIQVNTDRNIEGHGKLSTWVSDTVEDTLSRFSEHITRVEVHLSDENGSKKGENDKRCLMEARMKGRQSIAVTHDAPNVDQAVNGALDKLSRSIESVRGRLNDNRGRGRQPLPEDVTGDVPED
jgi:ribosome-associated translation inhibitor RaiA